MNGRFRKHQKFFNKKKEGSMVHFLLRFHTAPWRLFLKNVLIFEKKGADFFGFGLYGGLYGYNLPYKFKKSYDDI